MISVVIPLYNEEQNIELLLTRLLKTLDTYRDIYNYEIVLVNDGSQDQSFVLLKKFYDHNPDKIAILNFRSNFGQHISILAGFGIAQGDIIVTLDGDLQNPPEEIPNLLEKFREGYDYVGSYRKFRKDNFFRTYISKLINTIRESVTNIKMRDQGCMLRVYSREIIDLILRSNERSCFIPALAYTFAKNPTEIEVKHDARLHGESKYTLYKLIRLNFDLITGFSLAPLQFFTIFGLIVSIFNGILVLALLCRRFIFGPEAEGVFTLFAILFFLLSILIVGVGFIGEYIGRIFLSQSKRPLYIAQAIIKKKT
jgi:undecaprenyl-phosphate 4-deoxy-4-formamido-L-arabinose transferase